MITYYRPIFDGSKGYPLNGDPSAFHASFNIDSFSSSSVVFIPLFFQS